MQLWIPCRKEDERERKPAKLVPSIQTPWLICEGGVEPREAVRHHQLPQGQLAAEIMSDQTLIRARSSSNTAGTRPLEALGREHVGGGEE